MKALKTKTNSGASIAVWFTKRVDIIIVGTGINKYALLCKKDKQTQQLGVN